MVMMDSVVGMRDLAEEIRDLAEKIKVLGEIKTFQNNKLTHMEAYPQLSTVLNTINQSKSTSKRAKNHTNSHPGSK